MKLVRYGEPGAEKPGMIDSDGTLRDLSGEIADITGETLGDGALDRLRGLDAGNLPEVGGNPRIGPCVGRIGKYMCIGLNYSDHAAEQGLAIPEHPILFMKANSAVVGPNDTVVLPRGSKRSVRVKGEMAVGEMSIMAGGAELFLLLTGGNSWSVR